MCFYVNLEILKDFFYKSLYFFQHYHGNIYLPFLRSQKSQSQKYHNFKKSQIQKSQIHQSQKNYKIKSASKQLSSEHNLGDVISLSISHEIFQISI